MGLNPFATAKGPPPTASQHFWWRFFEQHLTNLSIVSMIVLLSMTVLYPFIVIIVPSGESAVLWKRFGGGTVLDPDRLMGEGIHLILPWDEAFLYDRRLQSFSDTFTAISRDGVSIKVAMNVRFRLNRDAIPALHEAIGPDYQHLLMIPEIGNRMREIIANYTAEQVYSVERPRIQSEILVRTQERLNEEQHLGDGRVSYVTLYDALLLNIELPQDVVSAINRKLNEFYASEAYDFRIQRERKESERKRIEAQGIHDFQTIIAGGITDSYLRLRGIEATLQLAQSPNSKVVIMGGGKDGIPVILNNVDTPVQAAPATPAAPTTGSTTPGPARVSSGTPAGQESTGAPTDQVFPGDQASPANQASAGTPADQASAARPAGQRSTNTSPIGETTTAPSTSTTSPAKAADGWRRYLPALMLARLRPVIEWIAGSADTDAETTQAHR